MDLKCGPVVQKHVQYKGLLLHVTCNILYPSKFIIGVDSVIITYAPVHLYVPKGAKTIFL